MKEKQQCIHTNELKSLTKAMAIVFLSATSTVSVASNNLAGGIWFNYQNINESTAGDEAPNSGDIGNEAMIFYADGQPEDSIWSYSAEMRVGSGSFTDPDNNNTGGQFGIHKAWLAFDMAENQKITVGKSQVPFGWKTTNFWPGDMYLAGYGDQMDVGIKLDGAADKLGYSLGYFHQDDWGTTSTDTMDDNRHWGSSTTYRKVQTVVGDVNYEFAEGQRFGVSLQTGKLQDLTANNDNKTDGSHSAGVLYYKGTFGQTFFNAQAITTNRQLPKDTVTVSGGTDEFKTTRYALELGRSSGNWTYYIDATWADTSTQGNDNDMIAAYAPGVKYKYGPGWIYAEYLTQNGYMDRNADVTADSYKFNALYLVVDYYF